MKVFAETSFLCSLYRGDNFSMRAISWAKRWGRAIPVSTLVRFEFRQSLRLQTRLWESNPAVGLSREQAQGLLRHEEMDYQHGVLEVLSVDWAAVHACAEKLSDKYTWDEAHRFADILHVATALCIGSDTFLTYDKKQSRLAGAEGLNVPE